MTLTATTKNPTAVHGVPNNNLAQTRTAHSTETQRERLRVRRATHRVINKRRNTVARSRERGNTTPYPISVLGRVMPPLPRVHKSAHFAAASTGGHHRNPACEAVMDTDETNLFPYVILQNRHLRLQIHSVVFPFLGDFSHAPSDDPCASLVALSFPGRIRLLPLPEPFASRFACFYLSRAHALLH